MTNSVLPFPVKSERQQDKPGEEHLDENLIRRDFS